jgi:hypothetical protein
MERNGLETAYLSSAAFVVGRRSLFDRRMLKPAPSTWPLTFWRLLEGGSAAAPSFFLHLECSSPLPCVSALAPLGAGGDCWCSSAELCEGDCGRGPLPVSLGEPS